MGTLAAVQPDRLGVLDGDSKCTARGGIGCWDEGREEAVFERVAGVIEGRLCYGVVLRSCEMH